MCVFLVYVCLCVSYMCVVYAHMGLNEHPQIYAHMGTRE